MMEPEYLGRLLLIVGGIIVLTGGILLLGGRFGLGRLPGDIFLQRENFTFYFPIVTGIIISLILTLILNIFLRR